MLGNETTISGWIVSFMIRERTREPHIASLSSTGYWIGNAIGRLILGYPTDKLGVRRATGLYIILAILIEFLFAIFLVSGYIRRPDDIARICHGSIISLWRLWF